MAGRLDLSFDLLLTRYRKAADLTQEELAEVAGVSARGISDLERGLTLRPRRDTTSRLADALDLTGPARAEFEAAARGHKPAGSAVVTETSDGPPTRGAGDPGDPRAWLALIVGALDERGVAAARSAVAHWQDHGSAEDAWLAWADRLITLTAEGRLPPASRRSLPTGSRGTFLGRDLQAAELADFAGRIQGGRGGLALVLGPVGIGKSRLVIEVMDALPGDVQVEWLTVDRGEGGYRGWRRLLAPMWITLRRTELAPASLLPHALILDDILLAGSESELAGMPFPGEVADAIAALLAHVAARQPLIVVIDDAHRGGASSDHLLIEVARRVNASRVGMIAALRPEELEQESSLRGYSDQVGGRAAADLVVPIHVPPLDRAATAVLLLELTGAQPLLTSDLSSW